MNLHIEHIESDNGPVPYWHVQRLLVTEARLTAARGLGSNLGGEIIVPLRLVQSWIHYDDLARQPFVPSPPDVHHRNETLTHIGDPQLLVHGGGMLGTWSYGARLGVSAPLGRTEPNPFELGRMGLPHQHVQFGTGTWNPLLYTGMGHAFGRGRLEASGFARLTLYANEHGYQAGNLYNANLTLSHPLPGRWGGFVGGSFNREEAELWSGRLEEEGNLGRKDVFFSMGVGHPIGDLGSLSISTLAPLYTHVEGEQAESPWVLSLHWTR